MVVTLDDAGTVGHLMRLVTDRTSARITGPRREIALERVAGSDGPATPAGRGARDGARVITEVMPDGLEPVVGGARGARWRCRSLPPASALTTNGRGRHLLSHDK